MPFDDVAASAGSGVDPVYSSAAGPGTGQARRRLPRGLGARCLLTRTPPIPKTADIGEAGRPENPARAMTSLRDLGSDHLPDCTG